MGDTDLILGGFNQFRTAHILAFVYRPVYTTFRKLQVCQCHTGGWTKPMSWVVPTYKLLSVACYNPCEKE